MKYLIFILTLCYSFVVQGNDTAHDPVSSQPTSNQSEVSDVERNRRYSKELDDLLAQQKVENARLVLLRTKEEIAQINIDDEVAATSSPKVKKTKQPAKTVFKPNIKVLAIFDEAATVNVDGSKKTVKSGEVVKGYEIVSVQPDLVIFKRLKTSKQYSVDF